MIKDYFKPETHYQLAERWFRVVEFSLIIATLDYFANKTDSNSLRFAYWISWFMFLNWFLELGEFLGDKIYPGSNRLKTFLITLFTTLPLIIIFILLNKIGAILATSQG